MARRCAVTGKGVQTGNNVSHANNKSRRRFLPNVRDVVFQSDALGRTVRLKVSANGLRSVEHNGGLDAWLLKADRSELSAQALRLKREIEKKMTTAH